LEAILFIALAIMLALCVPIFVALSACVLIVFIFFTGIPLETVVMRMFAGLDKFSLMSIPFFILAANVMSEGGISQRIINLANAMVGSFRGGLSMTTVVACMFFGAISGSSPATVVAIGALLFPALIKQGYSREFSTSLITASGSLGIVIPPSINMIVYGAITGVSVGALFMSGFGAGIVYGAGFMAYGYYYARQHPEILLQTKPSTKELMVVIKDSAWGMGVPVIILGGIYGGVFTPTEAAAVSVIYALAVSLLVYRELSFKKLWSTIVGSALTTAQVMIVLSAASVFAWILTAEGITTRIADSMLGISGNMYVILLMINIVVLIAGMFIDGASIITILAPLFAPIALKSGIDLIHLGIVLTVNSAIGMFTPPFGLNLFVATGVTGDSLTVVTKGIMPFILISLVTLAIITYAPEISLWLPRQVYGSW
jgi:C4-dicarboxylate transporter, DctM subunit